jgi:hypothetical protein
MTAAEISVGNPTDRAAAVRSNKLRQSAATTREYTFVHKSLAACFLKTLEH